MTGSPTEAWRGELVLLLSGALGGSVVGDALGSEPVIIALSILFAAVVVADVWDRERLDSLYQSVYRVALTFAP